MGSEFQLISQDGQRNLEEFSNEFAAAFTQGNTDSWAKRLGLAKTSSALKTTYPIPVSAALYREFKGDVKYRSLFAKSISLSPKTWQDGVAELASIIEAPDFTGWAEQPAAMAAAAMSLPNDIIAELLKTNAVQEFDGKAYFADDHPVNVFDDKFGTFDNDIAAGVTLTGLKRMKAHFRKLKSPNGKPLGTRMTHWLIGPDDEEAARDLLEQDLTIQAIGGGSFGAVDNRHKGTVDLVVLEELDDAPHHFGLSLNKPGLFPWIVQDEGTPEQIISDKSSALYATTLKIGIAYILRGNGGLALPQVMVRGSGTD